MKGQSPDSSLLRAGQHSHDQRASFSRFIEETGQWIFQVWSSQSNCADVGTIELGAGQGRLDGKAALV